MLGLVIDICLMLIWAAWPLLVILSFAQMLMDCEALTTSPIVLRKIVQKDSCQHSMYH